MNTNLFYFKDINSIGGVETFFYQLAKKYGKTHDITIMYANADSAQVKRLSKYVRVKKWTGERVKCKRCFVAFNASFLDHVDAEEYIQMLHGDYKSLGVIPDRHEKIQRYVAVSNVVRDAYKDITGDEAVVSYNPFMPEKPKKLLRLISATRLTPDKGFNRMMKLAKAFDDAGARYQWDIYSDTFKPIDNPNITLHSPRLDILDNIAASDYFVQLSDAEGYGYSIVEALSVGTPAIVTDIKVLKELGVVNGVNAFILPFDMKEIPVKEIYKGLKKFKYEAPKDGWDELLIPEPPDYEKSMKEIVKVKCRKVYLDLEMNRLTEMDEVWECTRKRAETLYDLGLVEIIEE